MLEQYANRQVEEFTAALEYAKNREHIIRQQLRDVEIECAVYEALIQFCKDLPEDYAAQTAVTLTGQS